MSARSELQAALTTALSSTTYHVAPEGPGTDARFPKKAWVAVQRAGAVPSAVSSGWSQALAVAVVVAPEKYSNAEDELDVHLPVVVAAVEAAGYAIVTIDRDVLFQEGDAAGWHGYRITIATHTTTI